MATFEDQLFSHLESFSTAPFLFVGSGFSRRYAGTEDWSGLLADLARKAGKPYQRYFSSANGDYPRMASLIAEDFHDVWWDSGDYDEHREKFDPPETRASPLKIEMASTFAQAVDKLPESGPLNEELEALRVAVLEGIITTNYDTILEYVFPDFVPFVGQDELLFRDAHGIAEIYKIHGSCDRPESLVITDADFERFSERNAYLAAKLLTVFVEHPVIFIGYSLTDKNVREIIASIASVLTNKNLDQLKNRLIFVEWKEKAKKSTMVASSFAFDGQAIPIHLVTVPDFLGVFQVLGGLKRRFPARILRHLKEEVYQLVRTSAPSKTVVVNDLESDTDVAAVDVVIGVGVSQRLESRGLVGLKRRDLFEDVLTPKIPKTQHGQVIQDVLPVVMSSARIHAPIYRYLRGAGMLEDDGVVKAGSKMPAAVRARYRLADTTMRSQGYFARRAEALVSAYPTLGALIAAAPLSDVLLSIPFLDPATLDLGELRDFLLLHVGLFDEGKQSDLTQWVKCVCFYDFLLSREAPAAKPRAARAKTA